MSIKLRLKRAWSGLLLRNHEDLEGLQAEYAEQAEVIDELGNIADAQQKSLVLMNQELENVNQNAVNHIAVLLTSAGGSMTVSPDLYETVLGSKFVVKIDRVQDGSVVFTVAEDDGEKAEGDAEAQFQEEEVGN